MLVVIEEALDQSEHFASYASMRLDEHSCLDKEERALIQARPKLSYEMFRGDIGTWLTFQKNQQEIYKMFANKAAGQLQLDSKFSSSYKFTAQS